MGAERERLAMEREKKAAWRRWGPYLSERQWGTVREDYSEYGTAWEYFPHDHARSRAYRWGEDGIAGICDNKQRLCFAPAFWNGKDPILKERLFGLTGNQGNHGEDVKESYFFLDNVPSHSYMKALYRYPHAEYPYYELVEGNAQRSRLDPEYELIDTGIFAEDRFFDITTEYAKASPSDILARISIANRGPENATIHVLPTLWFRNTWSWSTTASRPRLEAETETGDMRSLTALHETLGQHWFYCDGKSQLLFTENETNYERLYGCDNASKYVKDAFHRFVIDGELAAVNPFDAGTKAATYYVFELKPGETKTIRVRLSDAKHADPFADFDHIFDQRIAEADSFYREFNDFPSSPDERNVQRQAFAGMLWSKQFYDYSVRDWLKGDPTMPPPPPERLHGRNSGWEHLYAENVLSMPDTWEYPWFASWDLGFHCITLALIDPQFAKHQLMLLTREWYMHPNGQLPAYEWAFDDVNPPVHAWAAYRVFQIDEKMTGKRDVLFLERVFQKLLLNFTWWVNRKDAEGRNVFQGGFLGLDNIGLFDRGAPLPGGGTLDQSDGTSWMGVFTLNMLRIALELAQTLPAYEDIASKFFEHFLLIAQAMNRIGGAERGLWDETDGFYYDFLQVDDQAPMPLRIRSIVGLIPLMAVETFDANRLAQLPDFAKRVRWFARNRPDLLANIAHMNEGAIDDRRLMSFVDRDRLKRILSRMLDESEFLSPHGIRALSRVHKDHPYSIEIAGQEYSIDYEPGESTSGMFGGNSNWRGPVWFPVNYLLIEALQKFHWFYGDDLKIEFPTGSGKEMTLWDISTELSHRLIQLFTQDENGERAVFGTNKTYQNNPLWHDMIPFYEYFNGDTGEGLGASHQTGWTGLVAKLIQQRAEYAGQDKHPLENPSITSI
jgi:hypothetical protein